MVIGSGLANSKFPWSDVEDLDVALAIGNLTARIAPPHTRNRGGLGVNPHRHSCDAMTVDSGVVIGPRPAAQHPASGIPEALTPLPDIAAHVIKSEPKYRCLQSGFDAHSRTTNWGEHNVRVHAVSPNTSPARITIRKQRTRSFEPSLPRHRLGEGGRTTTRTITNELSRLLDSSS
jgi:hypothetical protein